MQNRRFILLAAVMLVLLVLVLIVTLTKVDTTSESGAIPAELRPGYQEIYLDLVAYRYQFDPRLDLDTALGPDWSQAQLQSTLQSMLDKTSPADSESVQRIHSLATALDIKLVRRDGVVAEQEEKDAVPKPLLLIALFLGMILIVIALVWSALKFKAMSDKPERPTRYKRSQAPSAWKGEVRLPLRQFSTTYTFGDNYYDPSFSIESERGEFLGECGVGIAQKLGRIGHKQIIALEVWLFDKSDVRTTQKFLVSNYTYQDQALHAKLAAKGELEIARPGQTLTLQTASLRLRARVVEAQYAESEHGERSVFGLLTVELGVWSH